MNYIVKLTTFLAIFLVGTESYVLSRECFGHYQCPDHKPACIDSICMDLCEGSCGINAVCRLRQRVTPVCYCFDGMIGDPFIKCWKSEDGNIDKQRKWEESSQGLMELISEIRFT